MQVTRGCGQVSGTLMMYVALLCGCSDSGPVAVRPVVKPLPVTIFTGAISEPGPASGSTASVVHVAFAPGELLNAASVTLSNLSQPALPAATYQVTNGGLDPVPVAARAGDTLMLRVSRGSAGEEIMVAVAPLARAPRVLRTVPAKGQLDVPIGTPLYIVFSEPIDPATVSGTIHLFAGPPEVAGRVVQRDAFTLEFLPDEVLRHTFIYHFNLSSVIRNVRGTQLTGALSVDFRTADRTTGDIRVDVITTGGDIPQSYVTSIASAAGVSAAPSLVVSATGAATFRDLTPGTYYVNLSGMAEHCAAATFMPAQVTVTARVTNVAFIEVQCERRTAPQAADVQKIAFVRGKDIFASTVQGGAEVRLTDVGTNSSPSWSPDGRRIVFSSERGGVSNLYVLDASSPATAARKTANTLPRPIVYDPAWSPTGTQLVFSRCCTPDNQIMTMRLDGQDTTAVAVTTHAGQHMQSSWSPDGSRIAFVSDRAAYDFVFDIYTVKPDGTDTRLLTQAFNVPVTTYYLHPAWSPDGSTIAFLRGDFVGTAMHFDVVLMKPDGSVIRKIADAGDIPYLSVRDPGSLTWSPDGSVVAYTHADCTGTVDFGCLPQRGRSIRFVTAAGVPQAGVILNAMNPTWRR